jgi:N6-L-threonylcarbamoyladenine synthase
MKILGIETSCDETSVAIVRNATEVLSNIIASSKEEQAKYGGVFPEVAARKQVECIIPAVKKALDEASMTPKDIDAMAVTKGPGLLTSLLVGVTAARTLAASWKKPLIGVHHTLGHLSSPWLECTEEIKFPLLALSVSGGHTELWLREGHTKGTLLGATRDDAAGEAFDKGAAQLGLSYPGGPALSKLAEGGNPHFIEFPRPLLGDKTCEFSFSGLKTSLKYALRDRGGLDTQSDAEKKDIAASFQEAICKHLVSRVEQAVRLHPHVSELHVVGGVSANSKLRELLKNSLDVKIRFPIKMEYCTDNAAMIAAAGEFLVSELGEDTYKSFETQPSLVLG